MPQANKLELQGGAAAKSEGEDGNDSGQNRNHAYDDTAVPPKSLDFSEIRSFAQAQVSVPLHGGPGALRARLLAPHQLSRELALGQLARAHLGPAMVDCHS